MSALDTFPFLIIPAGPHRIVVPYSVYDDHRNEVEEFAVIYNLKYPKDYNWMMDEHRNMIWYFKDADKAMLFKLIYGVSNG